MGRKPSYKCKRFDGREWSVLGWIHADTQGEAYRLATEKWGKVDSCYIDEYDLLPDREAD